MKKILLALGTLTAIAAPVISVISCGTSKKDHAAKQEDKSFENLKAKKIAELKTFKSLNEDQIEEFVFKINEAKNEADLNKIEKDFFNKLKQSAIADLDHNPNLDSSSFKKGVGEATTAEEIKQILSRVKIISEAKIHEAETKLQEELAIAVAKGLSYIENLPVLKSEEKSDLFNRIHGIENINNIDKLLLEATKTDAIEDIDTLIGLVEPQKSSWIAQVESSDSKEGVSKILNDLKVNLLEKNKRYYLETLERHNTILSRKLVNKVMKLKDNIHIFEQFQGILKGSILEETKKLAIEEILSYYSADSSKSSPLTKGDIDKDILEIKNCLDLDSIHGAMGKIRKYISVSINYACQKIDDIFPDSTNPEENKAFYAKLGDADESEYGSVIQEALLEKAKLDAIKSFENLITEQLDKNDFEGALKDANTIDEVNNLIQIQSLNIARTKAISQVNDDDLSSDQKTIWVLQLKLALDVYQINRAMDELKSFRTKSTPSVKMMPQ